MAKAHTVHGPARVNAPQPQKGNAHSITGGGLPATAHRGTATQNKVTPPPARPTFTSPGKPGYRGGGSVPERVKKIVFPNRTEN